MSSRNLIFIGDSHTGYISGSKKIRDVQEVAKKDFSKWQQPGKIESYIDGNKKFFWKHATTAWSLTVDSLKEIVPEEHRQTGDICIFSFGCVDLGNKLPIFKNSKELVKKYVLVCIEFSNNYGMIPVFVSPMYNGPSDEFNHFVKALDYECNANNINKPIIVQRNAIARFFESDDVWGHLSITDSKKCLDYIVEKVKKI